jgi:hypothetical protein
LFNSHKLDECLTLSKSAHKVNFSAVLGLRILAKSKLRFGFILPCFGDL